MFDAAQTGTCTENTLIPSDVLEPTETSSTLVRTHSIRRRIRSLPNHFQPRMSSKSGSWYGIERGTSPQPKGGKKLTLVLHFQVDSDAFRARSPSPLLDCR